MHAAAPTPGPAARRCATSVPQPDEGTDFIAIVPGIAAQSCLHIRWRDKEPGMGWFALGMGCLSVGSAAHAGHLRSGPALNPSPWHVVTGLSMGVIGPGRVACLGLPRQRRLRPIRAR